MAAIISQQMAQVLPEIVTQVHNTYQNSPSGSQYRHNNPETENANIFTFKLFNDAKPKPYFGTEGATGLLQWIESIEDTLDNINCPEDQKVKMAASAFQKGALTWWNAEKKTRGREAALGMSWEDFKTLVADHFCPPHEIQNLEAELWNLMQDGGNSMTYATRFQELCTLVPRLVSPMSKRIEKFIGGLPLVIRGTVMGSKPTTLESAIHLSAALTDEYVKAGLLVRTEGGPIQATELKEIEPPYKKQKMATNFVAAIPAIPVNQAPPSPQVRIQKAYTGPHPLCTKCQYHHPAHRSCYKCTKCGKMGHLGRNCRNSGNNLAAPTQMSVGVGQGACFNCGQIGHFKNQCPKLNTNTNGAPARVFLIKAPETHEETTVVMGTFPINN